MADFTPQHLRQPLDATVVEAINAAWAQGYNDCVATYARELHDALEKEGAFRDALEDW
jgi:hypothetical protein